MSDHQRAGPAFLNDLAPQVVLSASILDHVVEGTVNVRAAIIMAGSFFTSLTPTFEGASGNKEFMEYDAEMKSGGLIHGIVGLTKNDEGQIVRVTVGHYPKGPMLLLAAQVTANH